MKRATVYLRKARFFVHASSRTTAGVWVLAEPCLSLDESCDNQQLGEAIRDALGGSRSGVPHPRSWTGLVDPLLKQAGVKSWSTFSRTALCVEVEEEEGTVSAIPTMDLGIDAGFEAVPSRSISVDASAASEIGSSVRQLLKPSGGGRS
jgi:hypothetical protein